MNFKKRVAAVIGLVIAAIAACAFVWKPPEEIVVVVRGVDYSQYVEWHVPAQTHLSALDLWTKLQLDAEESQVGAGMLSDLDSDVKTVSNNPRRDDGDIPDLDLAEQCGVVPAGVALARDAAHPCDTEVIRPPDHRMLNPHLARLPGVAGYLLLIWRVTRAHRGYWPHDISIGLVRESTLLPVPHGYSGSDVGYRRVHPPYQAANQTKRQAEALHLRFQRFDLPFCMQVRDVRIVAVRMRLYILTTNTCGPEREVLIPCEFAIAFDEAKQVRRWRLWVSYETERLVFETPSPDPGPSINDFVGRPHVPPLPNMHNELERAEKNWGILPFLDTFIIIRHLCPLVALRVIGVHERGNTTVRDETPSSLRVRYLATVPLASVHPIPLLRRQDGLFALDQCGARAPDNVAVAPRHAPFADLDQLDSELWPRRTRTDIERAQLAGYVYPPYVNIGAAAPALRSVNDTEQEIARQLHDEPCSVPGIDELSKSLTDEHYELDTEDCLRQAMWGPPWRGGSDMIPVELGAALDERLDGSQGVLQVKYVLGIAHVKVWMNQHTVAFYYHFFYVIRLAGSTAATTRVTLAAQSRLFRFRPRNFPVREFCINMVVSGNRLLLTYGQGMKGQRAFTATVPLSTVEQMLYHRIRIPPSHESLSAERQWAARSPSVHLDWPHYSEHFRQRRQYKGKP